MFVIMGASGHIGGGLAAGLLKKGHTRWPGASLIIR